MSQKKVIILALVALWAAIFVGSYFMSIRIEGPRNIDTGFRRLDELARYQIVAFGVAIVSAVSGIVWRRDGQRIMLIGLAPVLITFILIAAIIGGSMIFAPDLTPQEAYQPPTPTATAAEALPPAQD